MVLGAKSEKSEEKSTFPVFPAFDPPRTLIFRDLRKQIAPWARKVAKVNFLGFPRFSWFCLRRGLIFQDQVHRNMQSAKSSTFSKNIFLENHRKTRFTISKYLVLKNEPSEVKKSGKSRKVEKVNFLRLRRPKARPVYRGPEK